MSRFNASRAHALRLNTGVSVEELALLAGVSPNTVRHALSGKHTPWPRVAAAIARALGVATAELTTPTGALTLGDIRRRLGLAQREIAQRVGVCRQMVSRVERGFSGVSTPETWARAYGLTPGQWLRAYQSSRNTSIKKAEQRTKGISGDA